jgi:hypothetical protein
VSPARHDFNDGQRLALIKLVGVLCVMVIALFLMVVLNTYQQNKADVQGKRQGCERNKLDRAANARAWREAQRARTRDGDLDTAAIYKSVADGLARRSRVDCKRQFPDTPFLRVAVAP